MIIPFRRCANLDSGSWYDRRTLGVSRLALPRAKGPLDRTNAVVYVSMESIVLGEPYPLITYRCRITVTSPSMRWSCSYVRSLRHLHRSCRGART